MNARDIPGLAVAVVQHGQTVWLRTFGLADVENQIPVTPQTMFRFASVSKAVTAVAVLRGVESGQLSLDAPVSVLIPELPAHLSSITLRQLLAHQSGLRHHQPPPSEGLPHFSRISDAFMLHAGEPLLFAPGTRVGYSTQAYGLLGWALERVHGRNFLDALKTQVFTPAGMVTARADDLYELIPHRAQGYFKGLGGDLRNSQPMDASAKIPGGGLCGTIADLAAFAAALQDDRLLSARFKDVMWTPQTLADGSLTVHSLGWFVGTRDKRREAYHAGTQARTSSFVYLLPDESSAVAILSNLEQVDHLELARRLADVWARVPSGVATR